MSNIVDIIQAEEVWDFEKVHTLFKDQTKRTTERKIAELNFLPTELSEEAITLPKNRFPIFEVLKHEANEARKRKELVLFAQLFPFSTGKKAIHFNDARGARYWVPYSDIKTALTMLQTYIDKKIFLIPHNELFDEIKDLDLKDISLPKHAFPKEFVLDTSAKKRTTPLSAHLKMLEDESIFIIREAVAEAENPVMLYSLGKDSSVMLHLAQKAFFPAILPFPLLHVDTRWKFQDMYAFRDQVIQFHNLKFIRYTNPEAIEKNINPFDHGSSLHTDITKTEGLKQAIDLHKFDLIFGGARRDEEKSRAKERVFSFRTTTHNWDPKNQRPELWNLFNTRKNKGETIRVFPLSNWTEADIWEYIKLENIPLVPLYFSDFRPVVERGGSLLLVDDNRLKLLPDEHIQIKKVRFRTLGCYPLTGAIESDASTIEEIVNEVLKTNVSERQGRLIDSDSNASMEKKKREGYF